MILFSLRVGKNAVTILAPARFSQVFIAGKHLHGLNPYISRTPPIQGNVTVKIPMSRYLTRELEKPSSDGLSAVVSLLQMRRKLHLRQTET